MTVWMLGLTLLLLIFGGISIDFWRALALQRHLAAMADSAAVAAASGIDEAHYRATGEVVLLPNRAVELASASVGFQALEPQRMAVTVDSAGTQVTVDLVDELDLGLLAVLTRDSEPILIRAVASATPRFVP